MKRAPGFITTVAALALLFLASAPVRAERRVLAEGGHLWNTGIINNNIFSSAFRIVTSGGDDLPIHSSMDFGFLENHRRKYIRFNIIGWGIQPDFPSDPRNWMKWFARLDLIPLTVAETGYIAFTPGGEIGVALRLSGEFGVIGSLRQAVDIGDPKNSLTSIQLGLIGAIGGVLD